ncbi:LacI family DNA-binding transcriptional regulator [Terrimonas alba]|uniref:LacI family DNA-binding transcriptional regulator n=1 Tax=Terrimonas alba TaxID=3349636 RepID=UPI0035F2494E
MKSHQISIIDIAKELGISKSTVSRALLGHSSVKEKTRIAVLELAAKLDYQRNTLALSLANKKTLLIGILVPEIMSSFFPSIIKGAEEIFEAEKYKSLICHSNENYEREVENVKLLLSQQVDGIIASHTKETRNFDHFKLIQRRGIPLVMFNRVTDLLDTPKVVVDDYEAAFTAVEHLIKKGRKRIAHLAGPDSLINSKLRLQGYLDALKKHKIPIDNNLIISYDLSLEKVKIYVQHFLTLSPPPDALFCMNDPTAIAAMRVIKQNKLRIPQDIAVVGFSNDLSSELVDPALTTMAQPTFDLGREAARLVLNEINNEGNTDGAKTNHKTVVLKTQLLIREST